MPDLKKAQQPALRAVIRHFSGVSRDGEGPPDADITLNGRKVALDIAIIASKLPSGKTPARARLREDRVAQRVLRDIDSAVRRQVPDGRTIIFTLGAPIKVPAKMVAALTDMLLAYLKTGAAEIDEKKTVLGNRIRFRVVKNRSMWTAKVIGFVFSGDPAPGLLAETLRELHDAVANAAKKRGPRRFAGERWLVLGNDHWIADGHTYRWAYSHLPPSRAFKKILMVFKGGRVEVLA